MADDQTNPYTIAGMAAMMQPNKYINPAFQNKPLPLPGFYGTPTDAQGNPIASFTQAQQAHDAWNAANPAPTAPAQGTTLNSTPQPGVIPFQHATMPDGMPYGQTSLGRGVTGTSWQGPGGGMAQQAPQQSAPATPQNPIDMRQAYLDALSNPGKVTTPGASVPQASPLGSPSVMNSFLAANPGGGGAGAGAGGYNNSGFFNTLNKLRSAQ